MEWEEQVELYNKVRELDRQEKYGDAFEILCHLDKEELPEAQSLLGFYYQNGRHVAEDAAKAEELFEAAGDGGYAPAYYHLARLIDYQRGIEPAKEYFLKAAEGGYMTALSHIAFGYEGRNRWDEVNLEKAFEYHKAASKAGQLGSRLRYCQGMAKGRFGPWRRVLGYLYFIPTIFQFIYYMFFRSGSERIRNMDLRALQKHGHEDLYK